MLAIKLYRSDELNKASLYLNFFRKVVWYFADRREKLEIQI